MPTASLFACARSLERRALAVELHAGGRRVADAAARLRAKSDERTRAMRALVEGCAADDRTPHEIRVRRGGGGARISVAREDDYGAELWRIEARG